MCQVAATGRMCHYRVLLEHVERVSNFVALLQSDLEEGEEVERRCGVFRRASLGPVHRAAQYGADA
jgi:hypothetical protein